jgi:ribosomal protein L12E/L44/L45/RPP1/RPP2
MEGGADAPPHFTTTTRSEPTMQFKKTLVVAASLVAFAVTAPACDDKKDDAKKEEKKDEKEKKEDKSE